MFSIKTKKINQQKERLHENQKINAESFRNPKNNFEGKSQDKNCKSDTEGNEPRMEQVTRI